jgi:hypothetical protein
MGGVELCKRKKLRIYETVLADRNVVETHSTDAILQNRLLILTITRRCMRHSFATQFWINTPGRKQRIVEREILLTMEANSRNCTVLE